MTNPQQVAKYLDNLGGYVKVGAADNAERATKVLDKKATDVCSKIANMKACTLDEGTELKQAVCAIGFSDAVRERVLQHVDDKVGATAEPNAGLDKKQQYCEGFLDYCLEQDWATVDNNWQ